MHYFSIKFKLKKKGRTTLHLQVTSPFGYPLSMSRIARIVVPGFPHHVTQRGNRGGDVFKADVDRDAYLRFLKIYCEKHGLAVRSYCLMPNHVHMVVVPETESSLGKALHGAHTVYAMHFNERTGASGHLWGSRFFSCPMDEAHLWSAVRYVELNPVRAGLVERAEDYPWSSAAGHCRLRKDPLLAKDFPPRGVIREWAAWLREPLEQEEEICMRVRRHTRTGWPCGTQGFLDEVEALTGHVARPQKRGPKPGTTYQKRSS
jgi:putative transposase